MSSTPVGPTSRKQYVPRNPLELWVVLLFGAIFVAMLVLTRLAVTQLGKGGVFGLVAVMGVTDVDLSGLRLTQSAGDHASFAGCGEYRDRDGRS